MRLTIEVGLANVRVAGGGPFAAMVASADGTIISLGFNQVVRHNDPTAHAEVLALRHAGQALGSYRLHGEHLPQLTLYTTSEPCIMCTGAIHWSGIPFVVSALHSQDAERLGFIERPGGFDPRQILEARGIGYETGFLRQEALRLFDGYEGDIYNG